MNVSMTWPEYLAGVCRIDGRLTRLRRQEAEVLLFLLVGNPDHFIRGADLIERMWPNPDREREYADKFPALMVSTLRKKGVVIEGAYGCGYRIPRSARGREQTKMAA